MKPELERGFGTIISACSGLLIVSSRLYCIDNGNESTTAQRRLNTHTSTTHDDSDKRGTGLTFVSRIGVFFFFFSFFSLLLKKSLLIRLRRRVLQEPRASRRGMATTERGTSDNRGCRKEMTTGSVFFVMFSFYYTNASEYTGP
jgi:hypothetical protein